jgi:hypothetical protein
LRFLRHTRARQLRGVSAVGEHAVQQLGGRYAIDERQPALARGARQPQHRPILLVEIGLPGHAHAQRIGDPRRELLQTHVRQPYETRAQEGSVPKIRGRIREVAEGREHVLDLVGVEEPQPFVDVRRDASGLEGRLECLMPFSRPEQDADVARPDPPGESRLAIAHRAARDQPIDLGSHPGRALRGVPPRHEPQHRVGRASHVLYRKAIGRLVPERIRPVAGFLDGVEQVVRERQQPGHGPEAPANRPAHRTARSQPLDVERRPCQHGDVRVAKAVDRLLAVADDEDGRRQRRVLFHAHAFAPGLHEAPHELPLRLAGVLELVHEQVVIARLQQVAALREFVHLGEQFERAPERLGKIHHGVRLERPAVLGEGDGKHAPDPVREHDVQVAAESREFCGDAGRERGGALAVTLPRARAVRVARGVSVPARARLAITGEEVIAQLLHEDADVPHDLRA